jgi:MFS family permease
VESILTSSFGNQVMMLALPLTAAVLLQATPTQMGLLTAIELLPFLLLSLPAGVWLDRVRKLPVYVVGECAGRRWRRPACRWPGGWAG